MRSRRRLRRALTAIATAVAAVAVSACGGSADGAAPDRIAVGMFANVTHAPALVGFANHTFADALGPDVHIDRFVFTTGTEAVEALFSGSLDLAFIGASPAINAFAQSDGRAIRVVAGSTSGGAFLIVRPGITSADDLRGARLATPSLGNTQDIALRAWLRGEGLTADPNGGGDVTILPQAGATTLDAFAAGAIDGAWVPEPWATRLVQDGGGAVLVDERDLWPETGGRYATTLLVARTAFLDAHPDLVRRFITGLVAAQDLIAADPAAAQRTVGSEIEDITGRKMSPELIATSFQHLTFTLNPIAASLRRSADNATAVGLLDPVDLDGLIDLTLLETQEP